MSICAILDHTSPSWFIFFPSMFFHLADLIFCSLLQDEIDFSRPETGKNVTKYHRSRCSLIRKGMNDVAYQISLIKFSSAIWPTWAAKSNSLALIWTDCNGMDLSPVPLSPASTLVRGSTIDITSVRTTLPRWSRKKHLKSVQNSSYIFNYCKNMLKSNNK